MVSVAVQMARQQGAENIWILCHAKEEEWAFIDPCTPPFKTALHSPLVFLRGGLWMVRYLPRGQVLIVPGDPMDGMFWSNSSTLQFYALLFFLSGIASTMRILGGSLSGSSRPLAVSLLRGLSRHTQAVCIRDQHSFVRAQKLGISGIKRVADLTFLSQPELPQDTNLQGALAKAEADGHVIVALVPYFPALTLPDECQALLRVLHATLTEMDKAYDGRCTVFFCPQDVRPGKRRWSSMRWTEEIRRLLQPTMRGRLFEQEATIAGYRENRAFLRQAHVCISGSFHAVISCLCEQVPPLCISYNDKVEGVLEEFGVPLTSVLRWQDVLRKGSLAADVQALLADREDLRARMAQALPGAKRMAMENLEGRACALSS